MSVLISVFIIVFIVPYEMVCDMCQSYYIYIYIYIGKGATDWNFRVMEEREMAALALRSLYNTTKDVHKDLSQENQRNSLRSL